MILNCDKLGFSYNGHKALEEVSFSVSSGELVAVLGPNGAGKTTLFRCILGILKDYNGKISKDDKDIRTLSKREAAKHIAYIPQIHRPTFGYTVLDTVLMGTTRQVGVFSQPKEEQLDRAWEAMKMAGIDMLWDRSFSHLSGGEQQLTLVARALAQQADILVMDEPTSSLDYGNQLRVLEMVKGLSEKGYGVLLSTHNPQHALSFSDKVLALAGGRLVSFGRPKELLTPELMRTIYKIDVAFVETEFGSAIVSKGGGSV